MFKQKLPTYTNKFLNFKNWLSFETDHYIFFYVKNSEAEKDILKIAEIQENAFKKITTNLSLDIPKKKITYYFYPDKKLKKKLMGDEWYAQSIHNEFCVHVLYTKNIKPIGPHEDTHLLTLSWGLSWNFLQEGLAEYMVGGHAWDGTSHSEYVKEGLKKKYDMYPSHQLSKEDWYNTPDDKAIYYYSLAGAWVNFLITKFSLESLVLLYKNTARNMSKDEIKAQYKKVYGKTVEELEKLFLAWIQ